MVEVEFEGIDELIEELEAIDADLPKIKKEALKAGADLFKDRLRESVYSYGLQPHSGNAPEYIDRSYPKNDEIYVGNTPDGFYLYFQEMGFYNVRARRFIPPKPFMSITFERSTDEIMDEYVRVLRKGLRMNE